MSLTRKIKNGKLKKYKSKVKYTPGFFAFLHTFGRDLKWNPHNLMNELYTSYKKGFYVYAEPKKFPDIKSGIEYVARYCGRVPISENRIISYNGNNVTFSYNDHKDQSYHEATLPASDFIMTLIRHLLPHQFKIIRYYGFYRKKHAIHKKMIPLIKPHVKNFRKKM